MIFHFIIQIIFTLIGLLALSAAVGNWEWFFSTKSSRSIIRNGTRKTARFFYGSLGIILILMAVYFFIKTHEAYSSLS